LNTADETVPQSPATDVLDEAVGENLDQLSTIDMRGDGILRVLYGAARGIQRSPLSLSAARALLGRVTRGDRVLMLTGFLCPKPYPETDGLIGSVVLAAALEKACGAIAVFVCEPDVTPPLAAGLRAAGMNVVRDLDSAAAAPHAAVILGFQANVDDAPEYSQGLARTISPVACIAVERPGANSKGQYHFALGRNASADIAPVDLLYEAARVAGSLTVGVGDFGNELGMGAIYETIRRETPAGAECGCGCGGGTACPTVADVTVVASVSDWGAYAVAACLAHLKRDPAILINADGYRRVSESVVAAGAIDGPSQYAVPHIDGIDANFNACLLEVMRGAASYPTRSRKHSVIRLFRAGRIALEA
jgi:D-glutamate cyclase